VFRYENPVHTLTFLLFILLARHRRSFVHRPSGGHISTRSRETARCFVSLNILLSHPRSRKVIRNNTVEQGVCKSLLVFLIELCRPTSLDVGHRPLRSACIHRLVVPRTKTSYGDRGFSVQCPRPLSVEQSAERLAVNGHVDRDI